MRTGYVYPSGNYNIVLSRDEVEELLKNKHLTIHIGRVPCIFNRVCYDGEKFISDGKKNIYNDLRFFVEDEISDINNGPHFVQYLGIHIDDK